MKVCEKCGIEIYTKDGDNLCSNCEKRITRNTNARKQRRAYADAMEALGLVKVRGAIGGTYWE